MKREIVVIFLLLLLSFPAVRALFIPGGYTSHDLTHHVIRQISMDKLLSEGQFPPRWSGELNNGYGYPVFLFNYPLPSMFGEVFHKLGFGFETAVKAVLFSSMILAVLGMYLFLKSLLGSQLASFLGAIFYLYAPIRFLNVYVSAAVGSALAQGLVPFVFWSMVEIWKDKKWAILTGGFFSALLILSHNVTTVIFAPLILVFAGYLIWNSKERQVLLRKLGVMFLLGVGLSAWFWIPATLEKQYTRFDLIFGKFYQDQFPSAWQLIRSPWGYGLSHPQAPEPGDMSYQIGLIHIAVIILLVLGLYFKRKSKEFRELGGLALITFILSILLMLKISLPLWGNLPFLSLIQFPLRFQAWAVFSASIAAALLIKYLSYKNNLFIALLFLVIYANRNHWNINQVFDPGENYYLSLKTTSTSFAEHLPLWGKIYDQASSGKLEFVSGRGKIKLLKDKSHKVLAEVEASTSSTLRFNQTYFPGWELKVDGKSQRIDAQSYGLPLFDIDTGKHQIEARFKNTPMRNLADSVSLISVILWGVLLCKLLIRH